MEIMVGESIVLPCQVTVDPALDVSFSWAFNGQLIDFEHDSEHFEKVGGVSKKPTVFWQIVLFYSAQYHENLFGQTHSLV